MTNSRAISYFLVRYGRLGRVGWFGSIHHATLPRGTNVVVHSATGRWAGVVLTQSLSNSRPNVGLTGELELTVVEAQSSKAAAETQLVMQAREWVERHTQESASSMMAPVLVLDGEIALDGDIGVVVFLGEPTSKLGIAAAELARQLGLIRIQWLSQETIVSEKTTDLPQESSHTLAEGSDLPKDNLNSLRELASLLDAADTHESSRLVKVSRRLRAELGLSGTYLQKLRKQNPVAQNDVPRQWMVRIKATAGRLSPGQLMALMEIARQHGNGTLRVTVRQGLQLHGIASRDLPRVQQSLQSLLLTARGSCGDSLRNVTCCPYPAADHVERKAQELAALIGKRWLPLAPWLEWFFEPEQRDKEVVPPSFTEELQDPAYPDGYLPHKWKIGVATPNHDCCDVLINDLALIVRSDEARGIVVDAYVGGGLASHPEPQLASPLGTIAYDRLDQLIQAIMDWHSEQSIGGGRRTRRLRYFVNAIGLAAFRQQISERLASTIDLFLLSTDGTHSQPNEKSLPEGQQNAASLRHLSHRHSRWTQLSDSTWSLQCLLSGGRIACSSVQEIASWRALLGFAKRVNLGPRLTLILHGIAAPDKERIEQHIQTAMKSVTAPDEAIRMLPCVAFPTCPFAVAEAERAQDFWQNAVQKQLPILERLGCVDDRANRPEFERESETNPLEVAISGCTNGCSRPWLATLGIIAEASDRYRVLVGGTPKQLARHIGYISGPQDLGELLIKWEQASQLSAPAAERVVDGAAMPCPPSSK